MNHADIDRVSLELHRRIALRLRQEPRLLDVARANLDRWMKRNGHIPSLRRVYEEWRGLLALPLEKLCGILVEETDEGQRLRQNSPFAGVLPREERFPAAHRVRPPATHVLTAPPLVEQLWNHRNTPRNQQLRLRRKHSSQARLEAVSRIYRSPVAAFSETLAR